LQSGLARRKILPSRHLKGKRLKSRDLAIQPSILARADEVIE
jgi:hypothetical protein